VLEHEATLINEPSRPFLLPEFFMEEETALEEAFQFGG